MNNGYSDRPADEEREAQTGKDPLCEETASAPDMPRLTRALATQLLEFSPDAMVLIDTAGTMVLANRQAAILFGYPQAELVDQPVEFLLPPDRRAAHIAHRASYIIAPHPRPMGVGLDLVGRRKDGSVFPVDISLRPVELEQTLHVVGAIRDITVQRFLERERVLQSERISQLTALVNLAQDAIFVLDPQGRILLWSQGAAELYGWSASEALGRVASVLLQTHFPAGRAAVELALEHTGHWEGELVHTARDGRRVFVECRRVLVRDANDKPSAILAIARDTTLRRTLERAQAATHTETLAQHAFLQELVDALPSSVYVVHGNEAHLVLANREATRIFGAVWPVGQPMQDFLEEHHIRLADAQGRLLPPDTWATMRALLDGDTVLQQQEVIRQPTGISLPLLVSAVPLFSAHWQSLEGGAPPSRSALGHTEPLALVVHQDVRLLKEAEYFKEEFIGITAHELRQPLSALKGAVGTLVLQTARGHGTPLADWQQEMLADLDQAADRLTDLVDDLLDVSRLQAGRLSLQRASTDLVTLVEHVVKRFRAVATRNPLTFESDVPTLVVHLDGRRIEQVLTNLLTNALKYSPEGGEVEVRIAPHPDRSLVEIQIRDHGIGIPTHQQAYIFGRFMRADNAQAAGLSGTGLGLYLCRALVEQHGGQLWFESTEGVGSTFFATLPLLPVRTSGPFA